jgi:hypothetical protein
MNRLAADWSVEDMNSDMPPIWMLLDVPTKKCLKMKHLILFYSLVPYTHYSLLDLQLPMQSAPMTTNVMSSKPDQARRTQPTENVLLYGRSDIA